jgi:AraC-like DNA-binding protein
MEFIYHEYQPSRSLQSIVDCYWIIRTTGSRNELSPKHRCLPLGMLELIIQLDDNFAHGTVCNRSYIFPKSYLVGIMKESVCWQMRGNSASFGVRLKPEGVLQLFQTPLADLCNGFADAESFLAKADTPIIERIREAPDHKARIFLMEAFLHSQLARFNPERNYFTEALKQIRSKEGNFTHTTLEKKLQVGERQLQRMFKDNLGLSPKSYFRIMRFRQAFDSVKAQQEVDWLELTHSLGYSDQSHFIRDFKEFAGVTPSALSA